MRPVLVILLTHMHVQTLKFDPSIGFCNDTRGICCENYVYQDGKCIECPAGTFGYNCNSRCPKNYYGELCNRKCDCSRFHVCNPTKGCIIDPYVLKDEYDSCVAEKEYSNRSGNCCINQWKAEQCIDCWEGFIGVNCEEPCPHERYGQFCLGRCNCNGNEICDKTLGCIALFTANFTQPIASFPKDLVNWKTPVGLALGLLFSAFILAVIIKFKRKQRKISILNQTNVDISTTTILEVPQVKVSEYPTLLRVPDTDIGIQTEAYSRLNDFKTCSEV
ncbi:multiple epidermal growth factor-like domains protein 10 isoform X1 [Magallana gigas]|uniref:multiple epidermal growth factor-like domains protein 10 isoform X1 n=1 Tax=Magallana gigas TaxID=29159 RepID=UPI00333E9FFB